MAKPTIAAVPLTQTVIRQDALTMISQRIEEIAKLMREERTVQAYENLRQLHGFVEFTQREQVKASNG